MTCKDLRDQYYPLFCVMCNTRTDGILEDVAGDSEIALDSIRLQMI